MPRICRNLATCFSCRATVETAYHPASVPSPLAARGDSQRRVLIDRSGGEASWKQANILVVRIPRIRVPGQDKLQEREKYAHSCTGALVAGFIALLYQPFSSLVNTAACHRDCVVMFIYQFDIKSVNKNPGRRPLRLSATVVTEFATAQITESGCIHFGQLVRETPLHKRRALELRVGSAIQREESSWPTLTYNSRTSPDVPTIFLRRHDEHAKQWMGLIDRKDAAVALAIVLAIATLPAAPADIINHEQHPPNDL